MKVHRFRTEWCVHSWLLVLIFAACCMLIQTQQYTWADVVDREIFKGISSIRSIASSGSGTTNNIERNFWPLMKSHDIWSDVPSYGNKKNFNDQELDTAKEGDNNIGQDEFELAYTSFDSVNTMDNDAGNPETKGIWNKKTLDQKDTPKRKKVLHIFPLPVDGECLSDDGRRTGTCFNAYECRQKGGLAKGECAMGFGVCCIFIANCNATISNNITYLVSPQFPSFMPNNFTSCSIKIKLVSEDISQLRIDFNHFSLGQPNRRTGVCDGDIFNISGGPAGTFSLCGQNSGQHIYYDVGGRALPRQSLYGSLRPPTLAQIYPNLNFNGTTDLTDQLIEISMNFSQRFLPIRLWEIRIAQIPFSQRAPAGCLQYYLGAEGILQTFNFADNGRHLANQHYRVCIRQETEMCSIIYQPCDEQSFRIGPSMPLRRIMEQNTSGSIVGGGGGGGGTGPIFNSGTMPASMILASMMTTSGTMPAIVSSAGITETAGTPTTTAMNTMSPSRKSTVSSAATMRTTIASPTTTQTTTSAIRPSTNGSTTPVTTSTTSTTIATTATPRTTTTTTTTTSATTISTTTTPTSTTTGATSPLSDDVEGSGDDDSPVTPGTSNVSRRPRPVRGGFDLLGFLRSAFDLGLGRQLNNQRLQHQLNTLQRQPRQIFSTCSDRITLPCIIEDFIGTGLGPLPSCEPVHCGTQFCSSGVWPCRIESTVTPFFLNIHFGDGTGKGSAEDNIGACLRYTQVQCM